MNIRTCPDCGKILKWDRIGGAYRHVGQNYSEDEYSKTHCYYEENSMGERVWDNKKQKEMVKRGLSRMEFEDLLEQKAREKANKDLGEEFI